MDVVARFMVSYSGTACAISLFIFGITLLFPFHKSQSFVCMNSHSWDIFRNKAKREFESNAEKLIKDALRKGLTAFQLVTNMGTYLILADQYAEELRNDKRLSAYDALNDVILLELPGLETMFQGSLHNHVSPTAIHAMNRELVHLTRALSDEANHRLQTQWTDSSEWHTVSIHDTVLALVAQMTTRAFVGAELCRNAEWLDIAINFTINRAIAVQAVQAWPWILQPVVHWFLPTCKAVRRQIQRARTILMPVLERERQTMHRKDSSSDRIFSTLTFIDQYAQGSRYDATMAQLRLTAVSVLTTSDMVEKVLARICEHPELIQPLREEVVSVFESSGLHHKSLLKLTLMESVMKESQRLEPATLISMFRAAKKTVTLQDGTTIPKGTRLAFANDLRLDPELYPDPETFDGYRFERMRKDPEQAKLAPFTKTRTSHLAFGHGKHACPGRFLSCDEAKLILCHILLKYDFKALDGRVPDLHVRSMFIQRDTGGMLSVRRRQEEVTL
ncbi:Fumitremorgin C monooxygenase [Penicillium chrysogenum]|uniref:Cytochrome P450 monooxygenase roqO n=2 Tax=Penicillium chrysogenum species complex TaxID=254878 RepID=ROQO_PENRW|nr:RecName: Full=Cytochrome P450 monooxygenase roqO; AltName: Full=Roquefortine/meleagrin synthesis protein O [Penicillium rubens Wisconsin 54-1255]KZN89153.1 Fumitremorgin C monooxygenase [Penicillium chrysogenum]CAP96442.1 Pc21g15450 [Penicillium rubens Wisconsin 54-1255]